MPSFQCSHCHYGLACYCYCMLLQIITIRSFSNSNIWVALGSIFQHQILEATSNVRSDIILYDLNQHTGRCDLEKFLNGNIATQAMVLQITSEPLIPVSNKQRDWAGYPNWLFHQHTYTNSLAVRSNALSITCRHSKCDMASPPPRLLLASAMRGF